MIFPTKSTSAKGTCELLNSLFNIFDVPTEIVSDRGSAHNFAQFLDAYNIKHKKIAVAFPWANGLVERANRFLKSSLTKMISEPNG